MNIIRFRVSDWFNYETLDLTKFIDNLVKEASNELEVGSQGVNYSWELWDMAIMFYITTTEEFIEKNNLQEIYKSRNVWICNDNSDVDSKFFPEYNPERLSKESGNGKYIEEND